MSEMVFAIGQDQIMSLIGHLVFGVVLGAVYHAMTARTSPSGRVGAGETSDKQPSR